MLHQDVTASHAPGKTTVHFPKITGRRDRKKNEANTTIVKNGAEGGAWP